jgi:putative transposase
MPRANRHYQTKNQKRAYWEDRYHAAEVETDRHLIQCLVYMDLNMERLRVKVKGREVFGEDGSHALRESPATYKGIFGHENDALRFETTYFGDDNP